MQIYGYHRTSTKEQHLDRGIQEIERYCNEHEMALTNIFTDQETGKNFNRPRYTVFSGGCPAAGRYFDCYRIGQTGKKQV